MTPQALVDPGKGEPAFSSQAQPGQVVKSKKKWPRDVCVQEGLSVTREHVLGPGELTSVSESDMQSIGPLRQAH